jgi:hypothetical protein
MILSTYHIIESKYLNFELIYSYLFYSNEKISLLISAKSNNDPLITGYSTTEIKKYSKYIEQINTISH